jgi:hypothetical protein
VSTFFRTRQLEPPILLAIAAMVMSLDIVCASNSAEVQLEFEYPELAFMDKLYS